MTASVTEVSEKAVPPAVSTVPVSAAEAIPHNQSKLVGSWEVTVSTPNHPEWTTEFQGLISFGGDGITISSDAADISIGLGTWKAGPDGRFTIKRRSNFIDATGVVSVLETIHHGALIDDDSFFALGDGRMLEPKGELLYEIPDVWIKGHRY